MWVQKDFGGVSVMDESAFLLIMNFGISALACFGIVAANDPFVRKISERKTVRTIIHIICGTLAFVIALRNLSF